VFRNINNLNKIVVCVTCEYKVVVLKRWFGCKTRGVNKARYLFCFFLEDEPPPAPPFAYFAIFSLVCARSIAALCRLVSFAGFFVMIDFVSSRCSLGKSCVCDLIFFTGIDVVFCSIIVF